MLAICCTIMFSEGFYATQIFPYVSWMTQDLRGNEVSLGTFTGLLYTAQSCGSLSSAYMWAKASNTYGRKKCLIVGLLCSVVTTFAIAFSTNYWTTFTLRLLSGLLNNNLSIVRTSLRESFASESEDDTSAFSMLSVAFGASCVAGPSLGGLLFGQQPTQMSILHAWSPPMLLCTMFYLSSVVVVQTCFPETKNSREKTSLEQTSEMDKEQRPVLLLRQPSFLMLLAMGGGHSYVFTGWELVYPLYARLQRFEGGEQWKTSQIGITFLVGSLGLMSYAPFLYPKFAKGTTVLHLWICQWILPLIAMPLFCRALSYMVASNVDSQSLPLVVLNYGSQLVVSVLLGSQFISIQLLLNQYVAQAQDPSTLLAIANSYLVTTQGIVRAVSPLVTGSLFTLGRHGILTGVSLPFDHLSLVGLTLCVLCAISYGRAIGA